jgi:hypothetical protein
VGGLSGYAVSGGVLMPLLTVPVPGAQPEAVSVEGAQLVVPKGAGVVPGVGFVCDGAVVPGTGALVGLGGEFTVGAVAGYGADAGGVVVVVPGPGLVVVVPGGPAAKAGRPVHTARTQPTARWRINDFFLDICFMTALLFSRARAQGTAVA